jgi:hypothetical protein
MTPEAFIKIGQRLYGRKKWKHCLSLALAVDVSTIHRIVKRSQIPGPYEIAVKALLQNKQSQDKLEQEARKLLPRRLRKRVRPFRTRRKRVRAQTDSGAGARHPQPGDDRPDEAPQPPPAPAGVLES